MTAYRYGVTRAHFMQWVSIRDQWEPSCGRPSLAVKPITWPDEQPLPMKFDLSERHMPWCAQCVAGVQREVDQLSTDVLIPAAQEVSE